MNLLKLAFGEIHEFIRTYFLAGLSRLEPLCEAVLPLPHTTIIMPLRLLELAEAAAEAQLSRGQEGLIF